MAETIRAISAVRQRMRLPAGCGADDAAQPAADPAQRDVGHRVGHAFLVVLVRDGRAGHVDASVGEPGLGALSEIGGHRLGRCWQRGDTAAATPGFPLPPCRGVHDAGGRGELGLDSGRDPLSVTSGQANQAVGADDGRSAREDGRALGRVLMHDTPPPHAAAETRRIERGPQRQGLWQGRIKSQMLSGSEITDLRA